MSEVPGGGRNEHLDQNDENEAVLVAGRYRLLSRLGEGGMGVVWRARDELLGREVAVKEVRAPAALGTADVRRLYARLEREGWAAARISQRNVVTVYDVATHDTRPWIVMELIRGLSLSDVLDAEGPMAPRRAAHIGAEVLAALRAAHEAGVLHRDVKPGNVLIANDGRVVLSDFGIATVEGATNLTMTGELVGSPEYLAPERALGRTPGPESDLWSLGVLLYAAVEGRSPFRQDTALSTMRAVVDEEPTPPRRAGALAGVIEGLLRKDPAQRMSAADAERELRVVGAGGAPRTGSTPPAQPGGYATTVTSATPSPSFNATTAGAAAPAGPVPPAGGFGPPTPPTGTTALSSGRPRRAVIALVAGIVVLLLSIGGLAYALLNDSDPRGAGGKSRTGGGGSVSGGGTGDGGSGAAGTSAGTSSGPDQSGSGTPTHSSSAPETTNGTGGGGGSHTYPATQTVRVYARSVRDRYHGTCPPSEAEAPAFSATVTVGRTPATVSYRWVTESGGTSADGWRTLSFPAGGGKSQDVHHIELTYAEDTTHHDRIRVEVRSPVEAWSNWLAFWVTCEREESPSPSGDTGDATGTRTDTGTGTGTGETGGAGRSEESPQRTVPSPSGYPDEPVTPPT
ncbi:serine/threonine-protein kinase [Streptomyces sp. NPDC127084]|uniref:serine/threonine-protein kinase n=1 Tax=Streptomyces sp. NPDC127084 TaxID=3347133 RepID=UPI003659946A